MTKELSQSLKRDFCWDSAIHASSPASASPERRLIYHLDLTAHASYGAITNASFPS